MDLLLSLLVHRMDFLGFAEKSLVVALFDDPGRLLGLGLADLECVVGRRLRTRLWEADRLWALARADAAWLAAGQGGVVFHGEEAYPAWLAEIPEPPFGLFHRGRLPVSGQALVAVVGTRLPSERARRAAWELGRDCAAAGIGLVSGLAQGIDGAAQAGVVSQGGYTNAVVAGGIDQIQPRLHRPLAQEILARGGCIVSEYGPGTPVLRHQFLCRNRIISGLCPVTVVVQAPERSGALSTAQHALEQGRDVYVHEEGCHGSQGAGTSALAQSGARVIRGLADLAEPWPGLD